MNTIEYGQGAVNNTIGWGQGAKVGSSFSNTKSVRFDGVDDYVTMGDVASLRFDYNDAFSFSFWLNRTTNSDTTCILARADENTPFSGYIVLIIGNKIYFRLRNNPSNNFFITGTVDIPNNTWTHYVVTYDGSNSVSGMTLYKNGVSETVTTTSNGTVSSFASLSLPFNLATRDNNPNVAYSGAMDEVSAYNVELSASAVTTIYNSGVPNDLTGTSGLVSWWRMGDGDTFPTLSDNGSGGNNGTMTNMTSGNIITNVPT